MTVISETISTISFCSQMEISQILIDRYHAYETIWNKNIKHQKVINLIIFGTSLASGTSNQNYLQNTTNIRFA